MVRSSAFLWAAKRVPSIRFRNGANAGSAAAAPSAGSAAPASAVSAHKASSGAIEDYELPARFQRKPIDQYEIDYINRGGRE